LFKAQINSKHQKSKFYSLGSYVPGENTEMDKICQPP